MSDRPKDRKYTKTHEWVKQQGDTALVGLTDFAVEHLGDLVYVQLPEVGRDVTAGESVCEVESVKAVGDVYSPVAGEVIEVNDGLSADQAPLASDPFGAGWLFKVRVTAGAPTSTLLDGAAYAAALASEGQA